VPINPTKSAFVFPGQGSQMVGMGRELAASEPASAAVFSAADDILGYSLSEICWDGPESSLHETEYTQPALLTHSIAVLEAFRVHHPDFTPAFVAGHSLGEFSALVAAGSLDFPAALRLVQTRGQVMKHAGEIAPGGMSAVLGLDVEAVESICAGVNADQSDSIWVANDNCPGQIVISGSLAGLEQAQERLLAGGAKRVIRLAVSIAAHSPLMEPALGPFRDALAAAEFEPPLVPIIGNVNAMGLRTPEDIRADLHAQLTARVRWTESVRAMLAAAVNTFLEFGPMDVLTGLLRRIDRSARGVALDSPQSWDLPA
jgi:[acyl-carrier-protein] S-malonyltransferase